MTTTATTATAAPAVAASASAPVALPTVQSEITRGNFIPYARLNELLIKLRVHGEGLFAPSFKLRPTKEGETMPPNVRLVLMDDERTLPIPIAEDGSFELPTFPQDQAKSMEFGGNVRKGHSAIALRVDLTTPPDQLDLYTVRRIVQVGQRLRSELLPWYLRWLFPQMEGVVVCSDRPDWRLTWTENGQPLELPLPVDPQSRDPYAAKNAPSRPCTALTGQENLPGAAKLKPPSEGPTFLYIKLRATRAS